MLKKEARSIYKEKRLALSAIERNKLDDLLLIQFQTAGLPFISSLLSFAAIEQNHEPNTELFADFLRFRNPEMKLAYPVSDLANDTMQAGLVHIDTAFHQNEWNIPEPVTNEFIPASMLDCVFVPLLAFDVEGRRVGYGKGFYDRYLVDCEPHCIKVGFSYFEPVEKLEDTNEFDVPLDICITPQQVYVF